MAFEIMESSWFNGFCQEKMECKVQILAKAFGVDFTLMSLRKA